MESLICEFADKIRFYDRVIKGGDNRVFVPTPKDIRIGTEIDFTITFGVSSKSIEVKGKVVAKVTKQGQGISGKAGVWVQLSEEERARIGKQLHIDEGDGQYVSTRAYPRFDKVYPVLILKPVTLSSHTENISLGGICLETSLPLPIGQTIRFSLDIDEDTLQLYGKISWRRPNKNQTGIQFRFQDEQVRNQLAEKIRIIAEEDNYVVHAKPTVLVVDDDFSILRKLEIILGERGFGVLTASTGTEALSIVREQLPGSILLDVLLSGMNGLELCRIIKKDAGTNHIPVVLTSALNEPDMRLMLNESGALSAIPKPFKLDVLSSLMEDILHYNRSRFSSPSPDLSDERRDDSRFLLYERCYFESEGLHVETYLREASDTGGFIISCWGDKKGSQGKLTLLGNLSHPVEVDVEVRHRVDWDLAINDQKRQMPGIGLKFLEGQGLETFKEWLKDFETNLRDKPVVLVVDDDPNQVEILNVILKRVGIGVVSLDSSIGVADTVLQIKPILVILDYMLPNINGSDICRAIKSNPETKDVKIWMFSSISEEHLEKIVEDSGADGFIQKGIRPSEIAYKVQTFLSSI